jgi:hypothetical protein
MLQTQRQAEINSTDKKLRETNFNMLGDVDGGSPSKKTFYASEAEKIINDEEAKKK